MLHRLIAAYGNKERFNQDLWRLASNWYEIDGAMFLLFLASSVSLKITVTHQLIVSMGSKWKFSIVDLLTRFWQFRKLQPSWCYGVNLHLPFHVNMPRSFPNKAKWHRLNCLQWLFKPILLWSYFVSVQSCSLFQGKERKDFDSLATIIAHYNSMSAVL